MEHLQWLLLYLLEREEEESVEKGARKNIQMKKANENIFFNFYPQNMVLVKTVMQIQLCKY